MLVLMYKSRTKTSTLTIHPHLRDQYKNHNYTILPSSLRSLCAARCIYAAAIAIS